MQSGARIARSHSMQPEDEQVNDESLPTRSLAHGQYYFATASRFSIRPTHLPPSIADQSQQMGEAVEPPTVTHFGQSSKDDPAETIDIIAQDDFPVAPDLNTEDDWTYPYSTDFVIQEKPIDEIKSLKVRTTHLRLKLLVPDINR